ncbi:MAG: hypothetical protein ABI051_08590 [Vicinamibacterales bacterium]
MRTSLAGLFVAARLLFASVVASAVGVPAAYVKPETLDGWRLYVEAVEQRRAGELSDPSRFLALDYVAPDERRVVSSGRIVTAALRARNPRSEAIPVPGAEVHHWRGAVFIPGVTVAEVMATLQEAPPKQADVLQARVLARGADSMKVYLRLRRSKIVTVIYDTEHDVRFWRYGNDRAASATIATGIAELDDVGTAAERRLPAGEDHGFLWRLNAYWRYSAVPGGVIAECESLTLSRGVPFGLRTIARPIIDSTARESMTSALEAVRDAATRHKTPGLPTNRGDPVS